jgi:rhodanese-related sulfurtransferase
MGPSRALLLDTIIVLAAGFAFALLANHFSPQGLSLRRDYFGRSEVSTPTPKPPDSAPIPINAPAEPNEVTQRLAAKGIGVVGTKEAEQLFRDPQYDQELIVFVDARDDHHYQAGHIPGAFQFDRYYPEKYLPTVLPACISAAKIVVYCTGGKCEDSEFAALALLDAGMPADKLSVYVGGINEWTAAKLPLETGARKSGLMKTP